MSARPVGDGLTDADLLVLCALADDIYARTRLGLPPSAAEGRFLRMMQKSDLWSPKG